MSTPLTVSLTCTSFNNKTFPATSCFIMASHDQRERRILQGLTGGSPPLPWTVLVAPLEIVLFLSPDKHGGDAVCSGPVPSQEEYIYNKSGNNGHFYTIRTNVWKPSPSPNFINNHIISAIQSLMPTLPALPISTFCIQSMPLFVSLIIIIIGWQPHRQQGWRPHRQHCLHGLAPELWNQDEQKQETSTNIIVLILWLFSMHLLW